MCRDCHSVLTPETNRQADFQRGWRGEGGGRWMAIRKKRPRDRLGAGVGGRLQLGGL